MGADWLFGGLVSACHVMAISYERKPTIVLDEKAGSCAQQRIAKIHLN